MDFLHLPLGLPRHSQRPWSWYEKPKVIKISKYMCVTVCLWKYSWYRETTISTPFEIMKILQPSRARSYGESGNDSWKLPPWPGIIIIITFTTIIIIIITINRHTACQSPWTPRDVSSLPLRPLARVQRQYHYDGGDGDDGGQHQHDEDAFHVLGENNIFPRNSKAPLPDTWSSGKDFNSRSILMRSNPAPLTLKSLKLFTISLNKRSKMSP